MERSAGALAGLRVIDLTRILAGPYCTQMLGDHGAEIIKIEPPQGDDTRGWGPPFKDGQSAYFTGLNRNKRSIGLDLSKPAGREVLLRFLEGADLLVENFKAGQMEKWGLGFDDALAERFPRLIYCRITGFGASGPYAGMPGYDAVAQVMSGLVSINGAADGPPFRIGVPISDLATGLYAATAILMAVVERARSGRGQRLDVSLIASSVALLHPHAANFLMSGQRPTRTGNAHPNIAPYELFQTANGLIFAAIGNDRQFQRFCAVLGRPELAAEARFRDNAERVAHREQLTAALAPLLAERDGPAFAEQLLREGIPAGPVLEIPEALAHPQVRAQDMVIEADGYRGLGVPVKMSRTPGAARRRPPLFAEHGRSLLAEAGYGVEEIERLMAEGIVAAVGGG